MISDSELNGINYINNHINNSNNNIYIPYYNNNNIYGSVKPLQYTFDNYGNVFPYVNEHYNNNTNNKLVKKISSPNINCSLDIKTNNPINKLNYIPSIVNNNNNNNSISFPLSLKHDSNITENKIEEFNSFINSHKPNLIEYICTHRGAKEVEKQIKKSPTECIQILISFINTNLPTIMTDIYGNYLCQKIIKISTQPQITQILLTISPSFFSIAKTNSGTHVLQTLLDYITTTNQEQIILSSIKTKELQMAYDINATHVLQKIINRIPEEQRLNLNEVILLNIKQLSLNKKGVCLIKEFISSNTTNINKQRVISALKENCLELAQDPFGNYAIQHILNKWSINECEIIIDIIIDNIFMLSKQKISSNVVEKIMELDELSRNKKDKICSLIFEENKFAQLLKNKFGKYVIQKGVCLISETFVHKVKQIIDKYTEMADNQKEKKFLGSFSDMIEHIL